MSAKHLIVLALVAYVTLQADSLPYATKGGQSYYTQSYSEPLKGSYVAPQQFAEPAYRQEPVVAAPAVVAPAQSVVAPTQSVVSAPAQVQASYSYEPAPVKGHYQPEQRFESTPRVQQHYESAPLPMTYAEPLKSSYVQPLVQRQVAPAPVYMSAPATTYQAPAYQAPAYQAPAYQAPAKGEYYQQSFERAPLPAQYESAPYKGSYTQSYSEPLKSSYVAPQPAMTYTAPAQVQAPSVQAETVAAPVKGQSFYQSEQRFEAPVRASKA